jgi:hypothetical protein
MRLSARACKDTASQDAIDPARRPAFAPMLLDGKLDAPNDIVSAGQSQYWPPLLAPAGRTCQRHHQSLNSGFREYGLIMEYLMKPSVR